MKRIVMVAGALLLGIGAVMAEQSIAVEQQSLMKAQGKNMYGVLGKTLKGEMPYDQAAVDAALAGLEKDVGKIASVFTPNPKEDVANANYGSSQKIWQNKADFDAKIPPVTQAIADAKVKARDAASLKVAFDAIQEKCTGCHETFRVKLK
jgi:cytochrome c556